ncbi:MAG: glutathione S-transferase family protein [Parvibaculum sp.]
MSMKLYNSQLSPYSARVRLAIYAKGLDVAIVDGFSTPELEAELCKLTPMQKVPVLVHGDVVVPESEVICEYLEDLGVGAPLRPDDAESRARMRLLSRLGDLYVMEPMTKLFGQINPKGRDQALVDARMAELNSGMAWLDHYLDGSPYAVGGKLTLADCALAPMLFFYKQIGPMFGFVDPFAKLKSACDYYKGLQQDAHAARVIEEVEVALKRVMGAKG